MKIEIDSQDLLEIFLDAGIQTVDAKALVLDIITLQENKNNPNNRQRSQSVAPTQTTPAPRPQSQPRREVARVQEVQEVHGDVVEEVESTFAPFEEEEEEKRPSITRVQGKSVGSRPKFDSFGGDSTGALRGR